MGRSAGERGAVRCQLPFTQEAALDSEEEPDGLHIGGAVIYSAPLSSRRPARLPTAGTAIRRGATAASAVPSHAAQELHELEQPLSSDQSLDDELRDYLDNIKRVSKRSRIWVQCKRRECRRGTSRTQVKDACCALQQGCHLPALSVCLLTNTFTWSNAGVPLPTQTYCLRVQSMND